MESPVDAEVNRPGMKLVKISLWFLISMASTIRSPELGRSKYHPAWLGRSEEGFGLPPWSWSLSTAQVAARLEMMCSRGEGQLAHKISIVRSVDLERDGSFELGELPSGEYYAKAVALSEEPSREGHRGWVSEWLRTPIRRGVRSQEVRFILSPDLTAKASVQGHPSGAARSMRRSPVEPPTRHGLGSFLDVVEDDVETLAAIGARVDGDIARLEPLVRGRM